MRTGADGNRRFEGTSIEMKDRELPLSLTSREKGRFVNFYCKRIRQHAPHERQGIMRIIDSTLRKGVTPEQIQIALENYEQSVQGLDVRLRKHIRSFFTAENIRLWQTPLRPEWPRSQKERHQDAGLDILDKLDALLD